VFLPDRRQHVTSQAFLDLFFVWIVSIFNARMETDGWLGDQCLVDERFARRQLYVGDRSRSLSSPVGRGPMVPSDAGIAVAAFVRRQ